MIEQMFLSSFLFDVVYIFYSSLFGSRIEGKSISRIFIPSKLTDYVSLFCVLLFVGSRGVFIE